MSVVAVKAGGDAPVTFKPAEAAFDTVTLLVEFLVVRDGLTAAGTGGDDRQYVLLRQQ